MFILSKVALLNQFFDLVDLLYEVLKLADLLIVLISFGASSGP